MTAVTRVEPEDSDTMTKTLRGMIQSMNVFKTEVNNKVSFIRHMQLFELSAVIIVDHCHMKTSIAVTYYFNVLHVFDVITSSLM